MSEVQLDRPCTGWRCDPSWKDGCKWFHTKCDNPFRAISPEQVGEHCHFYVKHNPRTDSEENEHKTRVVRYGGL